MPFTPLFRVFVCRCPAEFVILTVLMTIYGGIGVGDGRRRAFIFIEVGMNYAIEIAFANTIRLNGEFCQTLL